MVLARSACTPVQEHFSPLHAYIKLCVSGVYISTLDINIKATTALCCHIPRFSYLARVYHIRSVLALEDLHLDCPDPPGGWQKKLCGSDQNMNMLHHGFENLWVAGVSSKFSHVYSALNLI